MIYDGGFTIYGRTKRQKPFKKEAARLQQPLSN